MVRPADFGETLARSVDLRVAPPVANTAAITALLANERVDGLLVLETTNGTFWWFDDDSTAVAGPGVLVPDAGSGRWLAIGAGGGGAGVGAVNIMSVRGASTGNIANLASFTVAAVDGLTYVEGERILLKNQTNSEENGAYRVGVVAVGVAPLVRVGEADASAEMTAGVLVYVSEGTAAGNEWWYMTTDDAIVLGTTSLTFVQTPSAVDLTSVETRLSSTEVVDSTADSSLTIITSSIETRLSSTEVVDSTADSSLTIITSSIETRLSSTEVVDSTADSSLTIITSSIETRLSSTEVVDSTADSSLTIITSSIETRLSSTEVVDSTADSSLTIITSSIETRLSSTEVVDSTADSSLTIITSSIETRLSSHEVAAGFGLLRTATITSADFTTAGVGPESENIGAVLTDDMIPMMVRCKLTDAFDNGAGVSLTFELGWTGDTDRYITAFDCFTGSALENSEWEQGTPNVETQLGLPADSTQIVAAFTAGGDQLNNFTNGSLTIEIWGVNAA